MDFPFLRVETENSKAVLTIANPPVNALSAAVLDSITAATKHLAATGVKAIILTGEGDDVSLGRAVEAEEAAQILGRVLLEAIRLDPSPFATAIVMDVSPGIVVRGAGGGDGGKSGVAAGNGGAAAHRRRGRRHDFAHGAGSIARMIHLPASVRV